MSRETELSPPSTTSYSVEVGGDEEQFLESPVQQLEPPAQSPPSKTRPIRPMWLVVVFVFMLTYAGLDSWNNRPVQTATAPTTSAPAPVTAEATTSTSVVLAQPEVATPTTASVPTTAQPTTTTLPAEPVVIESGVASEGSRTQNVPAPNRGIVVVEVPQADAPTQVQLEPETQPSPSYDPSPTTVSELTEQDQAPSFSLATLRGRGEETEVVEVPFGYQDCRDWFARWFARSWAGLQVCGPYTVVIEVTVDFGRAVLMGDRVMVPIVAAVAGELVNPSGYEPLTSTTEVILLTDTLGYNNWPTQAELAAQANLYVTQWVSSGGIAYDDRVQQVEDQLCGESSSVIGEAFGFNVFQADFIGGC